MNIQCNNCGLKGHLYRECRNPVTSFGHIIFRVDRGEPEILMIQRKDSLCYIELLRGKYEIQNIKYIKTLLNNCTLEEKKRLLKYPFKKLWDLLWLNNGDKIVNYLKNDYEKGNRKYKILREGYYNKNMKCRINLEELINESSDNYKSSEWEFPKGRRNKNETNKETAEREFNEETNYEKKDYHILDNIMPLIEDYKSNNNVNYRHIYYIGYLVNKEKEAGIDKNRKEQLTEIKDIEWVSKSAALSKIRDYQYYRKEIIENIFELIEKIDLEYVIV